MTSPTLTELASRVERLTGPCREIIDRVDRSGDCWLWTGKLDERGRGRVWHCGKLMLHHRAVWEILIGPIPAGALLCHHCDNPRCANPYVAAVLAPWSFTKEVISAVHAELGKQDGPDEVRAAFDAWVTETDPDGALDVYQLARAYAAKVSPHGW